MSIEKKPKLRRGRVYRNLKLPAGLHEKFKEVATRDAKKIYNFYEEIINNFLTEMNQGNSVNYLFHRGVVRDITIGLTRETADAVRALSKVDSVPETRIMFTAIVQFAEKNGLIC
ncbi:MAG: hypothetical protein AB2990_07145 (plasmid) [Candidatus Symbiodolus clandestinus]